MNVYDILAEALDQLKGASLTIAFADLDGFHKIPAEQKESLLAAVLDFYARHFDRSDVQVHYAGRDEYLFLFPHRNKLLVKPAMDDLILRFAEEFEPHGLTFSLGIVQHPWDGTHASELLRRAEEALHKAKRRGRNQAFVLEEKMTMRTNYYKPSQLERLRMLAKAEERSEAEILRECLELYLQDRGS